MYGKRSLLKTEPLFISLALGLGLTLALLWLLNGDIPSAHADSPHYVAPDCTGVAAPCHTSIQEAVDAAVPGDEILVAAGTYTGVSARAGVTQVVYISKTVTIRGGYTTAFTDPPDPEANPTTLDALGQGRVLYVTGNISPVLEGLRITSGNAEGMGGYRLRYDAGGGVYIVTATVTLKDNQIFENHIDGYHGRGGGLSLIDGTALLQGNTFIANTATDAGGLFLWSSETTLIGNTITENGGGGGGGLFLRASAVTLIGNSISSNHSLWGGGLYIDGYSTASLSRNTVSTNTAYFSGGGLYVSWSHVTLFENTIASNIVNRFYGGGLYLTASSAELNRNAIRGNTAPYGGGGLHLFGSDSSFNGNTIISNTGAFGGGLCLEKSNATSSNDVIVDNQTDSLDYGGGLQVVGSSLRLLHTTITRNTGGDGNGNGVYVREYIEPGGPPPRIRTYSTVVLTNAILVSHTAGIIVTDGNMASLNGVLWFSNGTNTYGAGTITITQVITGDPAFASDGYHLTAGSAAIDQGVNTGVTTDLDGDARPDGCFLDIGADEFTTGVECKRIYLPLIMRQYP
jgi:hypothetical protein